MKRVSRRLVATQYLNGNATEILDMLTTQVATASTWQVTSMNGSGLMMTETLADGRTRNWTIPDGYWVLVAPDSGILAPYSPTVFAARYQDFADIYQQGITATGVVSRYEVGAVALPALLLGGSTSVVVTLSGSMGSTAYAYRRRAVSGVAVLSGLTITETSRTATSITFTVQAPGVASVAGVLLVDAFN